MSLPSSHHMGPHRAIQRRFSAAAETYAILATPQEKAAKMLIKRVPELPPQSRILEAGCGTGFLTAELAEKFPSHAITAVDLSPQMVQKAGERVGDASISFVCSDLLAFEDEPFDLIVSSSTLHWIHPFDDASVKLCSLLAPGGALHAAIMVEGTLEELHLSRRMAVPNKIPLASLPSGLAVLQSLAVNGFRIVHSEERTIVQEYTSPMEMLKAIHRKGLTAGIFSRSESLLTRTELDLVCETYTAHFGNSHGIVPASYELLFVEAVRL